MVTKEEFNSSNAWGLSCSIDLSGCSPEKIRSADSIRTFVYELCKQIDVRRFGECTIVHFGEDDRIAGYSMTQLIETSLISGHFANRTNAAYLDVFSCRYFDPSKVCDFAKTYFEANKLVATCTIRE